MGLDMDKLMDKMPMGFVSNMFKDMIGIELTPEQEKTAYEIVETLEKNKNKILFLIEHFDEIFEALIFISNYTKELKK